MLLRLTLPFGTMIVTCFIGKFWDKVTGIPCLNQPVTKSISHPNKVILRQYICYTNCTKYKSEWTGTKIIFDISEKDNKTQLVLTHQGLVPEYECFDICKNAWTTYIQNSLRSLITTGKGMPNGKDKPQTENEKELSAAH